MRHGSAVNSVSRVPCGRASDRPAPRTAWSSRTRPPGCWSPLPTPPAGRAVFTAGEWADIALRYPAPALEGTRTETDAGPGPLNSADGHRGEQLC
jgi:hypothetical protein